MGADFGFPIGPRLDLSIMPLDYLSLMSERGEIRA